MLPSTILCILSANRQNFARPVRRVIPSKGTADQDPPAKCGIVFTLAGDSLLVKVKADRLWWEEIETPFPDRNYFRTGGTRLIM